MLVQVAACKASGGKFEDATFPPTDASLGSPAAELGVATWRRVGEIEPRGARDKPGLLARAEGVGLALGALADEWLVGALNVVASNVEVVERLFVDMDHADEVRTAGARTPTAD